jgi:pimeloyl-ACP methyl ester carboxylesterase
LKRLVVIGVSFLLGAVVLLAATGAWLTWKRPLTVYAYQSRRALSAAGFTKSAIEGPSGRVVFWEKGKGPGLVLLHGAGDQAGTWSRVAPALSDRYHVLVPDLAGHGDSGPSAGPLAFDTVVGALEAILEARRAAAPFVLVGNSMGGWLAMWQAYAHPDRVSRVAVINGGSIRGESIEFTLMPENRDEAAKLLDALQDPASRKVPGFVLDDVVREARSGPIGRIARAAASLEPYLLDGRLTQVTVPVDLLWGVSDRVMPLEYARRMETELPRARLTAIPSCGHVPHRECPDRFLRALEELLAAPPPG